MRALPSGSRDIVEVTGRGDVRVMELQSVVVYTVIDIPAPKVPLDSDVDSPADGCLAWIKGQIKRCCLLFVCQRHCRDDGRVREGNYP